MPFGLKPCRNIRHRCSGTRMENYGFGGGNREGSANRAVKDGRVLHRRLVSPGAVIVPVTVRQQAQASRCPDLSGGAKG
jgi:hypothetical protein